MDQYATGGAFGMHAQRQLDQPACGRRRGDPDRELRRRWSADQLRVDGQQPADADHDQRRVDIGHATTTFSVTPSNATGAGNTATVHRHRRRKLVRHCGDYTNVMPIVNVTWGQAANWQSTASGNFGDGSRTVWVFRIDRAARHAGKLQGRPLHPLRIQRADDVPPDDDLVHACDFRKKTDYHNVNGPFSVSNGTTTSVSYAVVAAPFSLVPRVLLPARRTTSTCATGSSTRRHRIRARRRLATH